MSISISSATRASRSPKSKWAVGGRLSRGRAAWNARIERIDSAGGLRFSLGSRILKAFSNPRKFDPSLLPYVSCLEPAGVDCTGQPFSPFLGSGSRSESRHVEEVIEWQKRKLRPRNDLQKRLPRRARERRPYRSRRLGKARKKQPPRRLRPPRNTPGRPRQRRPSRSPRSNGRLGKKLLRKSNQRPSFHRLPPS